MASPPEAYSYSTSVVATKPRLREEVREELREEIRTLDMSRVSPEEKLRLEREAVQGSVGEVELFERSWRKTQPESLAEIERKVDALGSEPSLPAQVEAPRRSASVSTPSPRPGSSLTPAPVPGGPRRVRALSGRLSPSEEKAIARHLGAEVKRTTVMFNTTRGRVVEVEYTRGTEKTSTTVTVNTDGVVSTLDEIDTKLDTMAFPQAALPAEVLGPLESDLVPEGIGPSSAVGTSAADPSGPLSEAAKLAGEKPARPPAGKGRKVEAPKKKLGLGFAKKGPPPKQELASDAAAAPKPAGPEPPAAGGDVEGKGKRKFGLTFGRK